MKIRLIALTCLVMSGVAHGVEWQDLPQAQKDVLVDYADQWSQLDTTRRERLALGAERWRQMDATQRQDMVQRYDKWQKLDNNRRQELRQRWQEFRDLTPKQQHTRQKIFTSWITQQSPTSPTCPLQWPLPFG